MLKGLLNDKTGKGGAEFIKKKKLRNSSDFSKCQ